MELTLDRTLTLIAMEMGTGQQPSLVKLLALAQRQAVELMGRSKTEPEPEQPANDPAPGLFHEYRQKGTVDAVQLTEENIPDVANGCRFAWGADHEAGGNRYVLSHGQSVHAGDWVARGPCGGYRIVSDTAFRVSYAVEQEALVRPKCWVCKTTDAPWSACKKCRDDAWNALRARIKSRLVAAGFRGNQSNCNSVACCGSVSWFVENSEPNEQGSHVVPTDSEIDEAIKLADESCENDLEKP